MNKNASYPILFFLLFIGSFQTILAQTTYYVSPSGNDKNTGTFNSPFQSLQHAADKAAAAKGSTTILLRGGTYYLDKTIVIDAAGFLPSSLTIAAYEKETVNVSAGKKLTLNWKPYEKGIYQATIPAGMSFERLYVNNQLQHMARYPNYDSAARFFHGTAADAVAPNKVSQWKQPTGGYVHALHGYEWGGFHYRITGVNADRSLKLEGGWQNNRPMAMHQEHRFVENIFEELDAPGEWFLDRSKNILYCYPPQGVDLNAARIEVSNLLNSIELIGNASKPLKNIQISALNFQHNERSFMHTREPLVRSDWTIYRGGAILMNGTENCVVKNCSFIGIGGNAIMLSNYNKKDTVMGCHIAHIGANAVALIGDPKALRSPSFRYEDFIPYNKLDKTPGPLTNNYPQECVVTDNLLHDLGQLEKQATGVQIEMAESITVSHNSIYNTPRAGLNIGDGAFGGHILEYNDVFNTVLETGDHGAFNSWGRDRFWAPDREYMDSLVAAHPELILLDARKQTIIRNNRFRCDHGWDIDLDDGSSNYHIYNNVCLNGGLKLREGFHRTVENNIIINNTFHPHVWFQNSGDVFRHNIVMKPYAPIRVDYWGKEVDSNLLPDSAGIIMAQSVGTDKNSVVGQPMFVDAEHGNYTVKPNSPALKIGFANFPMEFGVKSPALRKLSQQPVIPALDGITPISKSTVFSFLGGEIKSVDGLGDRSAYGLPDEDGVIVISAKPNGLLYESGFREKDVIRSADGVPVKHAKMFQEIVKDRDWKGLFPVVIIRNQQQMLIILKAR
ncbi:PDZ domain-containing protein [Pseudoflavitalea sp. G-6-1-2]|uniref:PDZ domain-containing protein n=1 Tax=Pseudoflavitalea sp. G-6-1-2 TaxID=2728841 RepID=UPI001469AF5E|nr:PDZ domain-containing protein [Pseudoflavitalea sp. G-6-1-2]NML21738.1 PDZ domain-containing protein [Pseudoflavitalea sp. G-6-1-2]